MIVGIATLSVISWLRTIGADRIEALLQPAIDIAREGFPVSPVIAYFWGRAAAEFGPLPGAEFDGWRETFLRDGRAPRVGERWQAPGHAETLARLATPCWSGSRAGAAGCPT